MLNNNDNICYYTFKGVTFYMMRPYYALMPYEVYDVDIEPGIEEITFPAHMSKEKHRRLSFKLRDVMKQFPKIKKIIIQEDVLNIEISNFMFPNVRHIESHSINFQDNSKSLISIIDNSRKLLNAFCLKPDEILDLQDVDYICAYSCAGCMTTRIINDDKIEEANYNAFKGSSLELCYVDNIVTLGRIIVNVNYELPEIILDEYEDYVFSSDLNLSAIKKLTVSSIQSFNNLVAYKRYNRECIPVLHLHKVDCVDFDNLFYIKSWTSYIDIDTNDYFKSIDGVLYSKDGTELLLMPKYKTGKVSIPEGTKSIAPRACQECDIEEVVFPDSLINIGPEAFHNCRRLQNIHFNNKITKIAMSAFESCGFTTIKLPNSVKIIDRDAFARCQNLYSVELNEGLQYIRSNSFWGCTSLKTVKIPSSVFEIEKSAFNTKTIHSLELTGIPPVGLITSCISSIQAKNYSYNSPFIKIIQEGLEPIYIPKFIPENYAKNMDFELRITKTIQQNAYEYIDNKEYRQDVSLAIYKQTKSPELRKYLSRSGLSIAKRLFNNNNEKELIDFLKLDILKPATLKSLLKTVNESAPIKAYILQKLGDKQESTTFKL